MKRSMRIAALLPAALVTSIFFQNCGQPGTIATAGPVIQGPTGEPLVLAEEPPQVVVEPPPPVAVDPPIPPIVIPPPVVVDTPPVVVEPPPVVVVPPPVVVEPPPVVVVPPPVVVEPPPVVVVPPPVVVEPPPVVVDTPPVVVEYAIKPIVSSKFICEPFGNLNGGDTKGGLKAELVYLDPLSNRSLAEKNSFLVGDYFANTAEFVKTSSPIFLSQINVPTRKFSDGFRLSDGSFLSDTNGNKLIEYFALRMKSLLKLSDADPEGDYEFATISDDGSRLFLNDKEVVNNDMQHATWMRCSSSAVSLNKASKIPLTYYYNQGPRFEISNVMIWRKKPSANSSQHRLCGVGDQTKYWNANNGSAEGPYWTELKQDGWKIVDAANFELPNEQVNPCATQNANQIVSAAFSDVKDFTATLNITFLSKANIKAKLYKVVGTGVSVVQTFDFSSQAKDMISLNFAGLEDGAVYSVELLLEMPASGTQVLNEVRFQVVKK